MISLLTQVKAAVTYAPSIMGFVLLFAPRVITIESLIESLVALAGAVVAIVSITWKIRLDKRKQDAADDLNEAEIKKLNAETRKIELDNLERENRLNG